MPPVSNTQLTDLATLKKWLNIADSDVSADTTLNRLIIVGTTTIKQLINRVNFITNNYVEKYSGFGSTRLFLNTQPVTAVTSVIENGTRTLQPSPGGYQGSYRFDKFGLIGVNEAFYNSNLYEVSYTGGFALNSEEAYLAEQAVISLCNLWWKRRPHPDEIARSLGQQLTARYTEVELPPETNVIIKQLRRVV